MLLGPEVVIAIGIDLPKFESARSYKAVQGVIRQCKEL